MKIIMNKRNNNSRQNHYGHRNPKRGPPGILLFCETGRERKCYNEAIEILNHYYQQDIIGANNDDGGCGDNKKKGSLSLEEEIQMMKNETKKSPFQEYDTGCKGAVFIMFTAKNCNNIVKELVKEKENSKSDEKEAAGGPAVQDSSSSKTLEQNDNDDKKRKHEENNDDTRSKKQKIDSSSSTMDSIGHIWDPIQTIQSVIRDIRKKDTMAPRSRFITKMIPIQATCYANVEEIEAAVKELLQKYLLPIGVASYEKKQEDLKTNDAKEKEGDPGKESKLPTFKVEFRRRFCSHLKRDDVIELVANSVQLLSSDYLQSQNKIDQGNGDQAGTLDKVEASKTSGDKNKAQQLFSVDLTNPDYTIVIELCRTLCTMAVVKDGNSFQQFNLIKIQEDSNNDNEEE